MAAPARAVPARVHGALDHLLGRRWRDGDLQVIRNAANFVARLELGSNSLAIRVPRVDDAALQVDRASELAALRVAARAGLAPDMVAAEPRSGLLVTRWLEGTLLSMDEARSHGALEAVARALRKLHQLSGSLAIRRIDPGALIDRYLDRMTMVDDRLAGQARELRPAAAHLLAVSGERRVLCHCDPHHRNIVRNGALRFLDWEYAGFCHPLFDLAAYASYHGLDELSCERLLRAYSVDASGHVDGRESLQALQGWRWLFDYVWLLWLRVSIGSGEAGDSGADSASLLTRLQNARTIRRG